MKKELNPTDRFKRNFKRALSKSNTPPFLFAGSGLSIRYYNIPTWLDLLKSFVDENRDCFLYEFGYYSSKCNRDPLKIASILAEEFHEHWWKDARFEESRKKFQNIAGTDTEVVFKIELSLYIEAKKSINPLYDEEIRLLSKAVISGVLTTNWDDFLQSIFIDFKINIGQKEMLFSEHRAVGDIHKIHGCISNPQTLVLTSADYEKFIHNDHYLNSKILTLFVDFPILFMGYSLSDPNINHILKNIVACLDNDFLHLDKLDGRLFFIEWQSEPCTPTIESSTYSLKGFSIPIKKIKVHEYKAIFEVLSELPRTIPLEILRQLQEMVYEFVLTTEPTNKILVNGLEELDKIENLEVVVGFGNISKLQEKGVIGLQDMDLFEDILFGNISSENYHEIIEKLLPARINKKIYLPFFKYNKLTDNLNEDNSLKNFAESNYVLNRSNKITMSDYHAESQKKSFQKQVAGYQNLQELIDDNDLAHAIQKIPYLDKAKIQPELLHEYLKQNWKEKDSLKTVYMSHFRKCICIVDYLLYANHHP